MRLVLPLFSRGKYLDVRIGLSGADAPRPDAIQNMTAKLVAFRNGGMVKVSAGIVFEAQSLHQSA